MLMSFQIHKGGCGRGALVDNLALAMTSHRRWPVGRHPGGSRRALFAAAAVEAEAQRDASLAALRNPAPGQPVTITN